MSEYVGFEMLFKYISYSATMVDGCKKKDLIATCHVSHDAHDEIRRYNERACYETLVPRVTARLAELVRNVEGSTRLRDVMDPIAAIFRIALELPDMDIQKDLETFSVKRIADVPINHTPGSTIVCVVKE